MVARFGEARRHFGVGDGVRRLGVGDGVRRFGVGEALAERLGIAFLCAAVSGQMCHLTRTRRSY